MDPFLTEITKTLGFSSLAMVTVLWLKGWVVSPREVAAERDRREAAEKREEQIAERQTQLLDTLERHQDLLDKILDNQNTILSRLPGRRNP